MATNPQSAPTLEQLRVFATVVDAGSFSAAAARLGRSQPVVSYVMGVLESQLGFALFERGKRRPVLTERGAAVLTYARRMCVLGDELAASADKLRAGIESEITVALDPLFPSEVMATALKDFESRFATVQIGVRTEPLGRVLDLVLDRECVFGISLLVMDWPDVIEAREFGDVDFVPVAAPTHPLAAFTEPASMATVQEHLQLALRDTGTRTRHLDLAIGGIRTLRLNDLHLKHALLRAGLGWGHMPRHRVADDLAQGRLVKLSLASRPGGSQHYTLIHRLDAPPGSAAQWLMDRLIAAISTVRS